MEGVLRILFTTQPGAGHLHPLIRVARGLADRGHDVAVGAAASFHGAIEALGLRPLVAGLDWSTREMGQTFPDAARIPSGPARYAWARATVFAGATARAMAPDVAAIAERWPPDLVVREAAEYGGALGAELLGIPHAVIRSDTGSSSYSERHHVAASLEETRAALGLPPDRDGSTPFRYLHLSFAPEGLDELPAIAAPTSHRFRPVGWEPVDDSAVPAWLDDLLPERPTVYATLGTAFNTQDGLFDAIIEAFVDEPVNLVLTVGHEQDPARFSADRPGVVVKRWIPQGQVLAHCDAVITHGGFGTVSAALAHRRPLVLLPISADQPMNAARVASLGAGRVLDADHRSAAAIREVTGTVLHDPQYRRAAADVANRSMDREDLAAALDRLERLAVERTPQLTN